MGGSNASWEEGHSLTQPIVQDQSNGCLPSCAHFMGHAGKLATWGTSETASGNDNNCALGGEGVVL